MKKSTWLHLRIPFSFFLLPIFLFSWVNYGFVPWPRALSIFCILHLFLYPASNGYNSYFDKDEKSIGGLKNPPKVSRDLYITSLIFDLIALVWGWFISPAFAIMLLVYGLVSKAYSHPLIRLKKYPFTGWMAAGIFQGYFTYLMVQVGLEGGISEQMTNFLDVQFPAMLTTFMLLGSYPMTQVYQHEEDGQRGDRTISLYLGVLGTFHFTAMAFALSSAGFAWYFWNTIGAVGVLGFLGSLGPVLMFFGWWYVKVRKDPAQANFTYTMRLNLLSSLMLNLFFLSLWGWK